MSRWVPTVLIVLFVAASAVMVPIEADNGSPFVLMPTYPVGDEPVSLATADLDADGNRDLVLTNSASDTVSVFLGDGHGGFEDAGQFPTGLHPSGVAIVDFDGDGVPDLVVAAEASNELSLLPGVGDGTFGPDQPVALTGGPRSIVTGDFDGDTRVDVAVTTATSEEVAILLGTEDGTLVPSGRFVAGDDPRGLDVADLDGDGRLDLAVANAGSSEVSVFLGDGAGGFVPGPFVSVGDGPVDVVLDDLDCDGVPDLATSNALSGDVSVRLGVGDGTFARGLRHPVGLDPVSLVTGDYDGDGLLDLAVAVSGDPSIQLLVGTGGGGFDPGATVATAGRPAALVEADHDDDGRSDLAVILGDVDALLVLHTGVRRFYPAGDDPQRPAIGDLDGDGRLDLVMPNLISNDVSVMLGRGDGTFGPQARFFAGYGARAVAITDFDADGHADLAVANGRYSALGGIQILLGRGDGTFGPAERVGSYQLIGDVETADFNHDGWPDLVGTIIQSIQGIGQAQVELLLGHGDGTFGPETIYTVRSDPQAVDVADFDGDGHADVVTANAGFGSVSVLPGHGDGTLASPTDYPVGLQPMDVAAGDLSGDGIPDLAVVLNGDGELQLLIGEEDGTFANGERHDVGERPRSVVLADYDRDGLTDVVVVGASYSASHREWEGGLTLLRNLGGGEFERDSEIPNEREALLYASAGDLDGDGRPDLVFSTWGEVYSSTELGETAILLNRNQAPVARIVTEPEIQCTSAAGAPVTLDGSDSVNYEYPPDTDDAIERFEWLSGFEPGTCVESVGEGEIVETSLSIGAHDVALRVTDRVGKTGLDRITLEVTDRIKPDLQFSLPAQFALWPPNHRLVEIEIVVMASDTCSVPTFRLEDVTSTEEDDAPGPEDGATQEDIQDVELGTADTSVTLRAERSRSHGGRRYILNYSATDSFGNTRDRTLLFFVPLSLDGTADPLDLRVDPSEVGSVVRWTEVAGASTYNVIRGRLSEIQQSTDQFDLGDVACIAEASPLAHTEAQPDAELPPAGEGFFYLVEYDDGVPSSYGSESAAKPRVPSSGGCLAE